jgi:hypothetical protein
MGGAGDTEAGAGAPWSSSMATGEAEPSPGIVLATGPSLAAASGAGTPLAGTDVGDDTVTGCRSGVLSIALLLAAAAPDGSVEASWRDAVSSTSVGPADEPAMGASDWGAHASAPALALVGAAGAAWKSLNSKSSSSDTVAGGADCAASVELSTTRGGVTDAGAGAAGGDAVAAADDGAASWEGDAVEAVGLVAAVDAVRGVAGWARGGGRRVGAGGPRAREGRDRRGPANKQTNQRNTQITQHWPR